LSRFKKIEDKKNLNKCTSLWFQQVLLKSKNYYRNVSVCLDFRKFLIITKRYKLYRGSHCIKTTLKDIKSIAFKSCSCFIECYSSSSKFFLLFLTSLVNVPIVIYKSCSSSKSKKGFEKWKSLKIKRVFN